VPMGKKRDGASTISNPMLDATIDQARSGLHPLQEMVLGEDGEERRSAAAERAMRMVKDRHGRDSVRSRSESHLLNTAMDTVSAKRAVSDDVHDPYDAEQGVTNTTKARSKFTSFVKESMLEKAVFGKRDPDAEAELLKALWKGEAEHAVEHPPGLWTGLLFPESEKRMVYDILQMAAVLYTAYVVPLRLAFDSTPEIWSVAFIWDLVIDSFFFFDMFLSFHAYTRDLHSGRLETNPKVLRHDYLTGFFPIDFLACFPTDYILLLLGDTGEAEGARNMRLLRLMRISRTLRLARLLRIFRASRMATIHDFVQLRIVTHRGYKMVFEISSMTTLIFGVAHIIGCLWLHTGIVNAGVYPHGSWIDHRNWYRADASCSADIDFASNPQEGMDAIANRPDDPLFDVYEECLDTQRISHGHMYMESIYFTVVTMSSVGYGDITPRSGHEKAFTTGVIIVGGFLWAFVIALFSEMIHGMTENAREYDNKMRKVTSMLTFLGSEKEFETKVTKFYQFRFKKRRFFEAGMSNELPPRLRREFVALRFSEALYKVPFFRNVNDETLIKLCACMQSFSSQEGEVIIEQGDTDRDLFIIEIGSCESFIGDSTEPMEFLPEGSFFGEMSFFGLAQKRAATIITTTYSELNWLSYRDFSDVLDSDIDLRRRMCDFATLRRTMYEMDETDLEVSLQ
jgi:hypothetical protein